MGIAAIYGSVRDVETQDPIANCEISVNVRTDIFVRHSHEGGAYSIDVPAGSGYTITFSTFGYHIKFMEGINCPDNSLIRIECLLTKFEPHTPEPRPLSKRFRDLLKKSRRYIESRYIPGKPKEKDEDG